MLVGLIGRPGRRGRPPKLGVIPVTVKQQAERRQHRLQEVRRRTGADGADGAGSFWGTRWVWFTSVTALSCLQLVEQCEDEELMDVVLPRLTKMLSLWELLLAKVHKNTNTSTYIRNTSNR